MKFPPIDRSFLPIASLRVKSSDSTPPDPRYRGLAGVLLAFAALAALTVWLIQPPPPSPALVNPPPAPTGVRPTQPLRPLLSESENAEEALTEEAPPPRPAAAPIAEAPVAEAPESGPAAGSPPEPPIGLVTRPAPPPPVAPPAAPPPPAEPQPQLVSIASGGPGNFAVMRYGEQTLTVGISESVGPWQVRQILSNQVVLQQGKRRLVLSFARSGNSAPEPPAPAAPPDYSGRSPVAPSYPQPQPQFQEEPPAVVTPPETNQENTTEQQQQPDNIREER